MARKQERKYISFELGKSQVVEENERILNKPITPQQTPVASPTEATAPVPAAAPAAAPTAAPEAAPIAQPQSQVQQPQVQQPQVQQPQVQQPQPTAQAAQPIGMQSAGNRSKRTEQGITVLVPMEYYQQIVLMKMRTGIPIRDIALQAVIEFVDKHKND